MFSLVYDEKRALEVAREELLNQTPVEEIAVQYNTSVQRVNKLRLALKQIPA